MISMIRTTSPSVLWRSSAALMLTCALLEGAAGCGRPPQVAGENRELIVSLATAVSARNASWLDTNAELLDQKHARGQCTDAEYATFKTIIDKARAGEWKAAEDSVYALRDAQEPTAADLDNLSKRKLGSDHGLPRNQTKSAR
jgi:hypothetical protein